MLFFVDRHISASFLYGFIKNDFFKLFPLIVCFVLIKSYENYQEKRMRNAWAKRCAPSKIVLISGLGNMVFQLFTEITNLAAKVQLVTLCKHPQPWPMWVSTNFGVCACVLLINKARIKTKMSGGSAHGGVRFAVPRWRKKEMYGPWRLSTILHGPFFLAPHKM